MFKVNPDFEILSHQQDTLNKVINQMNGRALLADEVGLGKTIEAGLILKEYLLRGEVEKYLILVPASLAFQWTEEMVKKLDLKDILFNRKGRGWQYFDGQIASLDMAKRKEHAKYLKEMEFDMVIVDEAHRLKNDKTLNWKFVNELQKKYCLLLTATPVHNNLKELYNLVRIIAPNDYEGFNLFENDLKNNGKELIERYMVRHSQKEVSRVQTDRKVKNIYLEPTKHEKDLNKLLLEYTKEQLDLTDKNILNLLTYHRELASSTAALRNTLKGKSEVEKLKEIYKLADLIEVNAKLKKVLELLDGVDKKVIIFTEYRATQRYLIYHLSNNGYDVVPFSGDISNTAKEWAKKYFRGDSQVLVSTEAGSQGINLQFCNIVINYDLPWNPMKLEQRIGRIHRLGQTEDVFIYNLIINGTIEEKILHTLLQKIKICKKVMGGSAKLLDDSQYDAKLITNLKDLIDLEA